MLTGVSVFYAVGAALVLIIVLLRAKVPVGPAVFAGGLAVWLMRSAQWETLEAAFAALVRDAKTWDMLLAVTFVMSLEVLLRVSGTLSRMVNAVRRLFGLKATMALMPAFIGLLPSMGGARFSCPLVAEISRGEPFSPEQKSAANYWFRHIFEVCNPIVPGVMIGSITAGVPLIDLCLGLAWTAPLSFALGWYFILRPLRARQAEACGERGVRWSDLLEVLLALFPVLLNVALLLCLHCPVAVALGISVLTFGVLLRLLGREVDWGKTVRGSLDAKLLINISLILFFVKLFMTTGALPDLVAEMKASVLPYPVVLASVGFLTGVITGMSQAYIAMCMPLVAQADLGNLAFAAIVMLFGQMGQFVTPTHLCLIVTTDYFRANLLGTLIPVFKATAVMALIVAVGFCALL